MLNLMMSQDEIEKLKHLLSRDALRENLARAGVYMIGWEFLKNSLIQRPKELFTTCGLMPDDEYRAEILSRHKSSLMASCLWFKERGVLTDGDIKDIPDLRNYRNVIAHEVLNVLLNTKAQVDEEKLAKLFALLCRIDRWWLVEIEISSNEGFDGQEIDQNEVRSGQMETLWMLINSVYDFPKDAFNGTTP